MKTMGFLWGGVLRLPRTWWQRDHRSKLAPSKKGGVWISSFLPDFSRLTSVRIRFRADEEKLIIRGNNNDKDKLPKQLQKAVCVTEQ